MGEVSYEAAMRVALASGLGFTSAEETKGATEWAYREIQRLRADVARLRGERPERWRSGPETPLGVMIDDTGFSDGRL